MGFDLRLVDPGLILFVQIGAGLGIDIPPHRVVPVRFVRAVTGPTDASAPDIDDRGFVPFDNGPGPEPGPAVGIRRGKDSGGTVGPGPEARVALIRDRLDPSAKLFPVLSDASVELTFPAAGSPLDELGDPLDPTRGADIVAFRAVSTDSQVHDSILTLHHNAVDGPVTAQMLIRVYPVKTVPVQLHRITVNGVAPVTTAAEFDTIFGIVNGIYATAGVRFVLVRDAQGQPLFLDDDFLGGGGPGVLFTSQFAELPPVSQLSFKKGFLNVYLTHDFNEHGVLGIGIPRKNATGFHTNPCLFLQDQSTMGASDRLPAVAHATAHELGHTLNLEHFSLCISGQKEFRCNSLWARRSLMYTDLTLKTPGTENADFSGISKVGYGSLVVAGNTFRRAGQLLATKLRKGIPNSNEIDTARLAVDALSFTTV